jgi:DNA polymerase alpha subunit B
LDTPHSDFDSDDETIEDAETRADPDFQFMTVTKNYMYDPTRDRALILGEKIYDIGKEICEKPDDNLEESIKPAETQDLDSDEVEKFQKILQNNVNQPNYQAKVKCLGRIFSKSSKLEKNTTEMLGADETKVRRVKLDFSKVQKPVALFPGQTVIVEGSNLNGQLFVVDEIHTDRSLRHCPRITNIANPINLIVASAPFTNTDDLLFEPLTNLISVCKNNKPDVLILTGPFLDIQSAVLTDMSQSFDEHFNKIISSVMEAIG